MFKWHRRSNRSPYPACFGMYPALLALSLAWGEPALAQAMASADNMVTDVTTSGTGDSVEIFIRTSRRPDASVFALSSPSRIVVDIDQALPGKLTAPVNVNRGAVTDVSARELKEDQSTITRVTIMLNTPVDFTPEITDSGVKVKISPKAAAAGDAGFDDIAAELEKMQGSGAPASKPTEVVEEVVASPTPAGSSSPAPSPSGNATRSGGSPSQVASLSGAPAELTGLDFLPYEKRSRIRIAGTAPLNYSISPVGKDLQVVVDVPGASLPRSLQRPLDTSEFPSAVKMVSAYPLKDGRDGVRVAIKLRENVRYSVEEKGEQLFVDFPVPASISSKLPANAAAEPPAPMVAQQTREAVASPRFISSSGKVSSGDNGGDVDMGGLNGVMIGESGSSGNYTGRRISIDVREADLHNVFRMISNVSKLNIVAGDNVQGKVTVRLQNVPWDQALAVVLQSKGLGAVRFGNIVRIAPLSVLKDEQEARLQAQKASDNLEKLQTMILPLNYAIATDIKSQVEAALTSRGKLTLDSRTNAIIVEDTASGVAKARELAQSLDTQTPQVLIEARIVEVSTTFLREFGIQWGGDVNATANTGVSTGLYFPNGVQLAGGSTVAEGTVNLAGSGDPNWVVDIPTSSSAGALALSLGSISDIINVDARLTAIESMGKGKVISSPKVITVDNKEATISQGTRIPYETTSAAGTSVQFIEATLRLTVTPHITQDNRVFLKVRVTNNRPDFGQAVNGNPAIEVKEAATEVMVKDGDTTVLGGVYTVNEFENTTGLPGLQKIPILGWLFKGKTERSERKELLVFITPHVVTKKVANR